MTVTRLGSFFQTGSRPPPTSGDQSSQMQFKFVGEIVVQHFGRGGDGKLRDGLFHLVFGVDALVGRRLRARDGIGGCGRDARRAADDTKLANDRHQRRRQANQAKVGETTG